MSVEAIGVLNEKKKHNSSYKDIIKGILINSKNHDKTNPHEQQK
jgi:hypothetical protein